EHGRKDRLQDLGAMYIKIVDRGEVLQSHIVAMQDATASFDFSQPRYAPSFLQPTCLSKLLLSLKSLHALLICNRLRPNPKVDQDEQTWPSIRSCLSLVLLETGVDRCLIQTIKRCHLLKMKSD